jgi:hypothetical protein
LRMRNAMLPENAAIHVGDPVEQRQLAARWAG